MTVGRRAATLKEQMTSAPGTAATVPEDATVTGDSRGLRMGWTLAITSIALFMVTLDNLIVTNALDRKSVV